MNTMHTPEEKEGEGRDENDRRYSLPRVEAPDSLAPLWYEIEDLNRARGVDVAGRFARPSNQEELRYFESRIHHAIPDDLRNFLMVCSGFEDPWPCHRREPIFVDLVFFLGGIQFGWLEPDAANPRGEQYPIRGTDLITLESVGSLFDPKTEGPCLCYDRTYGAEGRIVEVDFGLRTYRVVAPSLRAWLEEGLARLREACT